MADNEGDFSNSTQESNSMEDLNSVKNDQTMQELPEYGLKTDQDAFRAYFSAEREKDPAWKVYNPNKSVYNLNEKFASNTHVVNWKLIPKPIQFGYSPGAGIEVYIKVPDAPRARVHFILTTTHRNTP